MRRKTNHHHLKWNSSSHSRLHCILSLQLSGPGTQAEGLGPAAENSVLEEVLEAPQKGRVDGERREHRRP